MAEETETHAEWCKRLSFRGQLALDHVRCKASDRCVSTFAREVVLDLRKRGRNV